MTMITDLLYKTDKPSDVGSQVGAGPSAPQITPSMPGVPQPPTSGGLLGGLQTGAISGTNPSLRGSQIGWGVGDHQIDMSPFTNQFQNVGAGNVNVGRYTHDPNIAKYDTKGEALNFFNAQQPLMMQRFRDEVDALSKRTAAMGRTGSAVFNRDTGYTSDRSLAAREAMLGNIGFQAVTNDAARNTQADIAREGMIGQNLGLRGQLDAGNMNRGLQASMANQAAGLQNQGLQAQLAMANQGMGFQRDMARQQWAQSERSYQDMLANQAMQDRANQLGMFGQGAQFGYDPTMGAVDLASLLMGASGQYGGQAGAITGALGQLMGGIYPAIGSMTGAQGGSDGGKKGGTPWGTLLGGAGTLLGGPVGGAIGGLVGSLFG